QGVDAELPEIRQPGLNAGEIPGPVTVAVREAPRIDLVDDRGPPPARIVPLDGIRWLREVIDLLNGHVVLVGCLWPGRRRVGEAECNRHDKSMQDLDNGKIRARMRPQRRERRKADPQAAGAGPVEERTTSSGSKSISSCDTVPPEIWPTSSSMTRRPIVSIGWRTVVSGGSMLLIRAESSKPTIDTLPGTLSPARRTARIAPRAIGSLAQTMPV